MQNLCIMSKCLVHYLLLNVYNKLCLDASDDKPVVDGHYPFSYS